MTSDNGAAVKQADGRDNVGARVAQLSVRVDRLTQQVESLVELVRGQNELLQRQFVVQTSATRNADTPTARLRVESDPAGPAGSDGYPDLVIRVRALVRSVVPAGSQVAVATKGDEELLLLEGRHGWHFPQTDGGVYAGHHPVDSDDAVRGLERLKSRGASFFVLPSTAFWWLDHYPGFAAHIRKYRLVLRNQEACLIFDLNSTERRKAPR